MFSCVEECAERLYQRDSLMIAGVKSCKVFHGAMGHEQTFQVVEEQMNCVVGV